MVSKSSYIYILFSVIGAMIIFHACVEGTSATSLNGFGKKEVRLSHENLEFKKQNLSIDGFVTWLSDKQNHLNKEETVSAVSFNIMCLPKESMALIELNSEKYDFEKFKSICAHYEDLTYFKLKIEVAEFAGELLKYNLQSPSEYDQRVKYVSFYMQHDIYLVQNNDTIYPALYEMERVFNTAPFAVAMFGFDNDKFNTSEAFTIVYDDKLFNKGLIKFNYQNNQLIDIPNITGL